MKLTIRAIEDGDREWIAHRTEQTFGDTVVVSRGCEHEPSKLDGLLVCRDATPCGVATWTVEDDVAELVTLDVLLPGRGIGTKLLARVEMALRGAGCRRIRLVTTNDNLDALRFYQLRGYRITAARPGAFEEARKVKPNLPKTGLGGIPIRDEIELEKEL
jgi:ribosomal protein S18 acetylase RimI-like enzyme